MILILKAMKVIYVRHLTNLTTLIALRMLLHAVGDCTVYVCDSLTPWNTVFLEKPAVSHLVKTFFEPYGL